MFPVLTPFTLAVFFRSPFQGSFQMGSLPQGGAPCGRLPWAILGRAFGAENQGLQELAVINE